VDEPQTENPQITILLKKVQAGEREAAERLFEAVYHHLRRMARHAMAGERKDHTLQPTALVNEAFVALFKKGNIDWQGREHFFAQMASTMRHKLIDHAKKHNAQKHRHIRTSLEGVSVGTDEDTEELLALEEAVTKLRSFDPELERIVELRFYGGATEDEIARELGVSARTVKRKWAAARGLMLDFLGGPRERHDAGGATPPEVP
jgi:RNA polymerase sigma-70 factor, ECF subfamily